MASFRALTLQNGQITQIQDADTLIVGAGISPSPTESAIYTVPLAVTVGQVVRVTTADNADVADADTTATVPVVGIVISKPTTTTAIVRYVGEVTGLAGLTAGSVYFLSTTAGAITATPPATTGNVVQKIGVARSATVLALHIDLNFVVI